MRNEEKDKEYLEVLKYIQGKELLYTNITLTKSDVDSWRYEKFWRRMLKRFFPDRYEIKLKMISYEVRSLVKEMVKRVDTFLAWGDEVGKKELEEE